MSEHEPEDGEQNGPAVYVKVALLLAVPVTVAVVVVAGHPGLWLLVGAAFGVWILVNERRIKQWNKIDNPSPTGGSEGVETEEPLFTVVEDREGHCRVDWRKRDET